MLTKTTITGSFTVESDGRINVREDTVIAEDGVELTRTYHRRWLEPGADVSAETDARLTAIVPVVWTPEIVTAFAEKQAQSALTVPKEKA